jgi:hypothetical protein
MLDFDLAKMYSVETRVLNQAVKRNIERFNENFMFQLNEYKWNLMSSQFVMTSKSKSPKSSFSSNVFKSWIRWIAFEPNTTSRKNEM